MPFYEADFLTKSQQKLSAKIANGSVPDETNKFSLFNGARLDPVQSAQLSFESCQETVRIFVGPSRVQITQDCAAGILTNVFAIAGRTMSCDEGGF